MAPEVIRAQGSYDRIYLNIYCRNGRYMEFWDYAVRIVQGEPTVDTLAADESFGGDPAEHAAQTRPHAQGLE